MITIGKKISEIRKQKGITQEELSELSKINLRTLQRIEKDETEPRGNTLNGICGALGINIEDVLDYGKTEDNNYLMYLHLSVICFIVIPFGNIILPLLLWLNKRDKVVNVQQQGGNIINYQILWTIVTNVLIITFFFLKIAHIAEAFYFIYFFMALYFLNFFYAIYAAIRINKGRLKNYYWSPIKFVG